MSTQCTDLFKWKRKTPMNVFSLEEASTKKKDNIKEWVKKIQMESSKAAQDAYGNRILHSDMYSEIIPDDETLYEAQILIDGWLKEKEFPDLHNELTFQHEPWCASSGLLLDSRSNHSDLDNNNDDSYLDDIRSKYLKDEKRRQFTDEISCSDVAPSSYQALCLQNIDTTEDIDDSLLVQEVMNNMLSKTVVKNVDLGLKPLSKIAKDPVPRMNLRHQQVKTKGKARRDKHKSILEERLLQKNIEQEARNKVINEEKAKLALQQKEEKSIQHEMVRIRKELQEEKKIRNEERKRKQMILEEAKQKLQEELRNEEKRKKLEKFNKSQTEEKMRVEFEEEVQAQSINEMKRKMAILHKHFCMWHDLIIQKRLNTGKAKVLADWKCKLKAWNAWKSYVSCIKSSQVAKEMEIMIKEKYRKEQMAANYHHKRLQGLCFINWLKYSRYRSEKKILQMEHKKTTRKIAMFLEAAAKDIKKTENMKNKKKQSTDREKSETKGDEFKKQIVELKRQQQEDIKKNIIKIKKVTSNENKHDTETRERAPKSTLIPKSSAEQHEICKQNPQTHIGKYFKNTKLKDAPLVKKDKASEKFSLDLDCDHHKDEVYATDEENSSARSTSCVPTACTLRTPLCRSGKETTKPLRLAMEEREQKRKERRMLLEERKRKKEEERLKELREKEDERLRLEEEEKQEVIRRKREEKRLAAEQEQQKQLRLEAVRLKTECAKRHYEKRLLLKYGLQPWLRLMEIKNINEKIATKYSYGTIMKLVFNEWHEYTRNNVLDRYASADSCYKRILLKRCLRSWQKVRFNLQNQNKAAQRHSLKRILRHVFKAWQDYVTDERILLWAKESTADDHNLVWINVVKEEKEERVREVRRNELRKKQRKKKFNMTRQRKLNYVIAQIAAISRVSVSN